MGRSLNSSVMADNQENGRVGRMFDVLRRYLTLRLDYARLTTAEKLTVLLSTAAFYACAVCVGTIVAIFLSVGVGHLLATTVAPVAAYLYVAAFYLLIFILLVVFRKKIFVDPICRFITKLFVKPPKD